jgi:hypothetical protein
VVEYARHRTRSHSELLQVADNAADSATGRLQFLGKIKSVMKKTKNKKNLKKKPYNTTKQKVSQMVIDFAYDFISMGDSIEIKQSYLNTACVAWNIAILPENLHKALIERFIEEYQELNPKAGDSDNLRHDVKLLIKEKLRLYPNEKIAIANAEIIDENGKDRIIVFSKAV